jgi:predicted RecB family nuclease
LRAHGEPEEPPSPFDEVLQRLGIRHETSHLQTLGEFVDLSPVPLADRSRRTQEAAKTGAPVIYQGSLASSLSLGGVEHLVIGIPDFLIATTDGYIIRDSKISRRINDKDHPEIIHQLQLYGLLLERTLGKAPAELQVHSGTGEIVSVPYDGGAGVSAELERVLRYKQSQAEPYSPVGWGKCGDCPFRGRCIGQAEAEHDIALVIGVDQNLARALRDVGVRSRSDFLTQFDETTLADFKKPWGKSSQRVGKAAPKILLMVRTMEQQKPQLLERPSLPQCPNYVMFDLEGMPPHLDELDKVYLWGAQVFGEKPSGFLGVTAAFGPEGDRAGWDAFLDIARNLFETYGDLPFVHWHNYERVRLDMYVQRFGDSGGTAARVRKNLLDLLPITQHSVALPLPSYSLKVVERYIGFKRTQQEYGGDWAMAKYIEAIETEDETKRAEFMAQILEYNREDLEATWEVLRWLQTQDWRGVGGRRDSS